MGAQNLGKKNNNNKRNILCKLAGKTRATSYEPSSVQCTDVAGHRHMFFTRAYIYIYIKSEQYYYYIRIKTEIPAWAVQCLKSI